MKAKQRVVIAAGICRKRLPGNGAIEHVAHRDAVKVAGLHTKTDQPARADIHYHKVPVAAQENGFAAEEVNTPEAIFGMAEKRKP